MGLKLDKINPNTLLIGAGLLAVAYLVWRGPGKVAGDAVEAIGSAFGIPETNTERCAQAKASGSLWDQSFYCTAPDFLGSLLTQPGNVAAGAVEGIGGVFGIPKTSPDKCAQAKASGSLLDRSLYCSAGEFLGSLLNGNGGGAAYDEMGNVIY